MFGRASQSLFTSRRSFHSVLFFFLVKRNFNQNCAVKTCWPHKRKFVFVYTCKPFQGLQFAFAHFAFDVQSSLVKCET